MSSSLPCPICTPLGNDLTVNTGRDERFPDAFSKLVKMSDEYYRCPGCSTYFKWIDWPQEYGSGNNAEEQLLRQTPERSMELDKAHGLT